MVVVARVVYDSGSVGRSAGRRWGCRGTVKGTAILTEADHCGQEQRDAHENYIEQPGVGGGEGVGGECRGCGGESSLQPRPEELGFGLGLTKAVEGLTHPIVRMVKADGLAAKPVAGPYALHVPKDAEQTFRVVVREGQTGKEAKEER